MKKKQCRTAVWYPASQHPVEDGWYLVSTLYVEGGNDCTEIKTAKCIKGDWSSFADGMKGGEKLTYWMLIPTLPDHPPFTQLHESLYTNP